LPLFPFLYSFALSPFSAKFVSSASCKQFTLDPFTRQRQGRQCEASERGLGTSCDMPGVRHGIQRSESRWREACAGAGIRLGFITAQMSAYVPCPPATLRSPGAGVPSGEFQQYREWTSGSVLRQWTSTGGARCSWIGVMHQVTQADSGISGRYRSET